MALCRLAAALIVLSLAHVSTVVSEVAEQDILKGQAIVIEQDFPNGQLGRKLLAVQTRPDRRFRVVFQNEGLTEQLLEGVYTGMDISVSGSWVQRGPSKRTREAAGSTSSTSSIACAFCFNASSISVSGALYAPPEEDPTDAPPDGTGLPAFSAGTNRSTTSAAGASLPFMRNKLVARNLSALFIPIAGVAPNGSACPGSALPTATKADIERAVFAELHPLGATVGSTFKRCSYSRTKLTQDNSMVADLVELPCSGRTNGVAWSFQQCGFDDFNGWADAAEAVLRRRGLDLTKYKYRVFLVPPRPCAFVGLGQVGCDKALAGIYGCRTWIGGDFWHTPQAMVHELSHNLFMGHAGARTKDGSIDEYGDSSSTLGYCCADRCFDTPHAWQAGWLSVQQLNGSSLRAGQTMEITLAPQATSARSGLRIVPTWAPGLDPVFVGFRTRAAGDADLDRNLAGKANIYTAAITNTYDAKPTTWVAALGAGQSWEQPGSGLVVRVKAVAFNAVITVCRTGGFETVSTCLAKQDNDCNGLAGTADVACARLLNVSTPAAKKAPVKPQPNG